MKIISLFSGAGGLDLGLVQSGHTVVWANDNDFDACETYRNNIGEHIVCDDIENIKINIGANNKAKAVNMKSAESKIPNKAFRKS